MKLDGDIPVYSEGEGWQRQLHIYQSPFYYIDYCLAQTVALEIWALLQKDRKEAWERYMAYTRQGGSEVFTTLLKNAGLESPFDETACAPCAKRRRAGWIITISPASNNPRAERKAGRARHMNKRRPAF